MPLELTACLCTFLWLCLPREREKPCSVAIMTLLSFLLCKTVGRTLWCLSVISSLLWLGEKSSWRFSLLILTHYWFAFLCGQLGKNSYNFSRSALESAMKNTYLSPTSVHSCIDKHVLQFLYFYLALVITEVTLENKPNVQWQGSILINYGK